jgi:hypothetical protein
MARVSHLAQLIGRLLSGGNVGFVGFLEESGAHAGMQSSGMLGHLENPTANPTTNPTRQVVTAVSGTETDVWEEHF